MQEAERIKQQRDAEYDTCRERARQRARTERDSQERDVEADAARRIQASNDLAERIDSIKAAIDDPIEFFQGALSPDSDFRKLLLANGELKDPQLATETYEYLTRQYKKGTSAVPSSKLTQAIQHGFLDELGKYHRHLFGDFNRTLAQMARIGAVQPSGKVERRFEPSPIQAFPGGPRPKSPDCATLKNIDASRRLQEDNLERWHALFEECQK